MRNYSAVSNIGDIGSLEEGSYEARVILEICQVSLDAVLERLV
jgi:hypothetical protein